MPSFDQFLVQRRQHVRGTAEQQAVVTPPPTPDHPYLMPLALVVVDEQPVDRDGAYREQWGTLPAPFADTLDELTRAAPDASHCWVCGSSAVGWTDAADERGWEWQLTGLLWSPLTPDDPVNVLCEGCTPLVLEQPAPDVPL